MWCVCVYSFPFRAPEVTGAVRNEFSHVAQKHYCAQLNFLVAKERTCKQTDVDNRLYDPLLCVRV